LGNFGSPKAGDGVKFVGSKFIGSPKGQLLAPTCQSCEI
jgi:hypothetical protein